MEVKAELMPIVAKNKANACRNDAYSVLHELASIKNNSATVVVSAATAR
jgi:hypothetical protein